MLCVQDTDFSNETVRKTPHSCHKSSRRNQRYDAFVCLYHFPDQFVQKHQKHPTSSRPRKPRANIFGHVCMCSTYLLGLPLFLGTAGTAGSIGLALFATCRCLLLVTATGRGLLLGSGGLGHLAAEKMAFKKCRGRLAVASHAGRPAISRACQPSRFTYELYVRHKSFPPHFCQMTFQIIARTGNGQHSPRLLALLG